MNLDYGDLLTRAWRITWKHKILWIFGFLAGLGSVSGGPPGNNGGGNGGRSSSGAGGNFDLPPQWQEFVNRIDVNTVIAIAIGVTCLLLLLFVVLMLLSAIGRGGLIGGARLANTHGSVTFGEAWGIGARNLWRLFLIRVVVALPALVLVLMALGLGAVVAVSYFASSSADVRSIGPIASILLCLIPLFCVLIPATLFIQIAFFFAPFAAVLEDLPVRAALSRSWQVLKDNFGSALVMAALLFAVRFVSGIVLAIPVFLALTPIIVGVIGFVTDNQAVGFGGFGAALLCCAAYLPVLIAFGSVLETWLTSAWTLTYEKFIGPAPAPALAPSVSPLM